MPWPRRVTHLLWAVSVVLVVLTVVAVRDLGDPAGAWIVGGTVLASGVPFAAGFLAVRHDPRNWVGPWLTAAGANILLQMAHGNWADALAAAAERPRGQRRAPQPHPGHLDGLVPPVRDGAAALPRRPPADAWARRTAIALPALGRRVQPAARGGARAADTPPGRLAATVREHWVGYGCIPALVVFYACLVACGVGDPSSLPGRGRRPRASAAALDVRLLPERSGDDPVVLGRLPAHRDPIVALGGLVAMNIAIPTATLGGDAAP
jgi:hypothetical protein